MDSPDLTLDRLRALPSEERADAARAAHAAQPDLVDALLAWGEPRLAGTTPVERDDFFFCTDIAPAFEGVYRGRIELLDAGLRAVHGDSTQNVIGLIIASIGHDPGCALAHEMLYETLAGEPSLVWEDAVERLPRLPPEVDCFFHHVLERAVCWQSGDPSSMRLDPRASATLAEAEALAATGQLAEAIAARRGATGEDFVAARRAVCEGR